MAIASIAHAHDPVRVIVGVDTHKDSHVAHAKDGLGRDLGHLEVPTTAPGYASLLAWSKDFGVEGTSSYGIGLARYLQGEGQLVLEVIRPGRQDRRFRGKSDPSMQRWRPPRFCPGRLATCLAPRRKRSR